MNQKVWFDNHTMELPINLTFVSLINTISAGSCIIKPSEITDHTKNYQKYY